MSFETVMGTASCALVGAGLLAYGLYQRSRMQASQSWPQVPGTITQAGIALEDDGESRSYYVSVLYDYAVDGVRYTGKRIGFDRRTYVRKKRAESELARYPVNSSVPVCFDPQTPEEAVLARESPNSAMLIICGCGLLGLAAFILLYGAT